MLRKDETEEQVRYAFFDVDGTLSAPCYMDTRGRRVIGFSPEEWVSHCEREGKAAYHLCRPIPGMYAFVQRLQAAGCRLFVLSTTMSAAEEEAKRAFLGEHYPGCFEAYYFVSRDDDKLPEMEKVAAGYGAGLGQCMLVEDTFATLLKARTRGVTAVHVSNVLAGNVSR